MHPKAGTIQSHIQMFPRVQPENFISVLDVVGFMMKLPPASQVDWVRGQHCPLREQPPVHYKVSGDPRVSAGTYIMNSAKAAWSALKYKAQDIGCCSPMANLVGDETPLRLGRGGDAGAGDVRGGLLGRRLLTQRSQPSHTDFGVLPHISAELEGNPLGLTVGHALMRCHNPTPSSPLLPLH